MHVFTGLQNPKRCNWSDEFQKNSGQFFFGNSCSKDFGDPGCHPSTLIDLAITALASKSTVKTMCMISSGYRTHRGDTGPMNFKKIRRFFSETRTRGILCTVCHPSTIIDLAITALASRGIVKAICMFSEGYRTHRYVTGPMSFKKSGRFLSENRAPGILGSWLPFKHFN